MRKALLIIAAIVIFILGSVGVRWHSYVTGTDGLYDEVGITFNSKMPYPLRKWGCDKLQATYIGKLPPLGCKAEGGTGRDWM